MDKKLKLAIGIQLLMMVIALAPPLFIKMTGQTVYLETMQVDPRALFRGDYVILDYQVGQDAITQEMSNMARNQNRPIYITVTTERPARFVHASLQRPKLAYDQACLIGRARGWRNTTVNFPQIAQYFVPEGKGREIERMRGSELLAKVKTSKRCNAVLLDLEKR